VASGALGYHLKNNMNVAFDEDSRTKKTAQHVTQMQAEASLHQLVSVGSSTPSPTMHDVMEMDPTVLSMMMTQLVLNVSGSNAHSICEQLERATGVQAELRNKQVLEYQEQINKAISQADHARKAGIVNAVFDWIIGGVEAVTGILKIAEGILTADPLAIADGAAYCSAGVAGMVKAGAETALLLGADTGTCNEIIKDAGYAQLACEGVALALDVMQIGRGIRAARAITKAAEEVLESGMGEKLMNAMANAGEGGLKTLEKLATEAGQEVSGALKNFGMPLEREMVAVREMAGEAEAWALKSEANMLRSMGKAFTRKGIERLVKDAIEEVVLKAVKDMVIEKLRKDILQKILVRIVGTVIQHSTTKALTVARAAAGGAKQISTSIVALRTAELHRLIEHLIVQQGFIDFMQDLTEENKKTQVKRLTKAYQDGADAARIASEIIDNYGTMLANIAVFRA